MASVLSRPQCVNDVPQLLFTTKPPYNLLVQKVNWTVIKESIDNLQLSTLFFHPKDQFTPGAAMDDTGHKAHVQEGTTVVQPGQENHKSKHRKKTNQLNSEKESLSDVHTKDISITS